ncbi:hypothetical protein BJ742DRAFT_771977 [Cladochytrium replicatum]|nr:hypothetical protein BJ742DRAFT_771977 [Cladochytrium replicatum]
MESAGFFAGRGRGWYYKEKYGRGNFPINRQSKKSLTSNLESPGLGSTSGKDNHTALAYQLENIDGRSYGAYKSLNGSQYVLPDGLSIFIGHVQSDPFAPPSRIRCRIDMSVARIPPTLWSNRVRRVALEDYLTRQMCKNLSAKNLDVARGMGGWHGSKGGNFSMDTPGQQVLERSSINVTSEYIEARLTLSLPAQGRTIQGRFAKQLLVNDLPAVVHASLAYSSLSATDVSAFVDSIEDQENLRSLVCAAGLVAFVRNGAVLPRESGASDSPMNGSEAVPLVPFQSPPELEKEFTLQNCGSVRGMGIPKGITLICGGMLDKSVEFRPKFSLPGGFHGKSTLLQAIQMGVFNHIPGDGREFVCSDPTMTKIRAEDGRSVSCVDISPYISNLPFGKDTSNFSTRDASGSTSMAANIQEALEVGVKAFCFDEDTCATNFLVRDLRMQKLISKASEPITPLISKIQDLKNDLGVSSILVIGGCGSYLDVADVVISMENYRARDVTLLAKEITVQIPDPVEKVGETYGRMTARTPCFLPSASASNAEPSDTGNPRKRRNAARGTDDIEFEDVHVDLSALEQIVHASQARCILGCMNVILGGSQTSRTLKAWVEELEEGWNNPAETGAPLDNVMKSGCLVGDYARPRSHEIAGAINRLRGLSARQVVPHTFHFRVEHRLRGAFSEVSNLVDTDHNSAVVRQHTDVFESFGEFVNALIHEAGISDVELDVEWSRREWWSFSGRQFATFVMTWSARIIGGVAMGDEYWIMFIKDCLDAHIWRVAVVQSRGPKDLAVLKRFEDGHRSYASAGTGDAKIGPFAVLIRPILSRYIVKDIPKNGGSGCDPKRLQKSYNIFDWAAASS